MTSLLAPGDRTRGRQAPPPVQWHADGRRRRRRARRPEPLGYVPALDGLRAAAVLAVMLYHGGVSWMRGGYLGVDAFFVLSGFLITALLLEEWRRSQRIDLRAFWVRRARRLLPALGLVVLGVIAYAAFLAPAHQLSSLRADLISTLGYGTNWRLIFSGQGYFEQFAAPSPLRHAWSLAIEEQFYLVWPLVVLGLCRGLRISWRAMAMLFAALAIASAVWMAIAESTDGVSRAYYGTDTRAQALLIGAALAVVFVSVPRAYGAVTRSALSIATLVATGITAWLWVTAGDDARWLYQGGYLVAAVAVAAVIARIAQPRPGVLGAVLSLAPVRWVGRISYGLYLWHWPIFVVITTDRVGLDGAPLLLVRFGITFTAATASYSLVEMPVRNGALRGWRSWAVVPTAAGALVAGVLLVTSGARPVIASNDRDAAVEAEVQERNREVEAALEARPQTGPARPTALLVVGDSVALTLGLGLQDVGLEHEIFTVNRSQMGCGLFHDGEVLVEGRVQTIAEWCDQAPKWAASVQELDPDLSLMLIGAWDAYDRRIDGRWITFGTPEWDELFLADLQAGVDALASNGGRVVLATVPHYRHPSVVNQPEEFKSAFDPWRVDHINELIRQTARANAGRVALIDLQRYIAQPGNEALLDDGVHFGPETRKVVAEWIAPRLRRLALS